jgi:hypothetical protein
MAWEAPMDAEQKPLRLLTGKEAAALSVANTEEHGDNPWAEWKLMQAVQRKFCEVNGLPEPAHNRGVLGAHESKENDRG